MRNLVLIIASLSMSGYTELKPNQEQANSLFQLLGFTIPQPTGRGPYNTIFLAVFGNIDEYNDE